MTKSSPTNRNAILSFIAALLTMFAFCIGFVPIPLTALICYPVSLACGMTALALGLKSLREIGQSAQPGRTLALIGVWSGALTIAAVICASTAFALLLPRLADYVGQLTN